MKEVLGDCNDKCFKFQVLSPRNRALYTVKYGSEIAGNQEQVTYMIERQLLISETVAAKGDISSLWSRKELNICKP